MRHRIARDAIWHRARLINFSLHLIFLACYLRAAGSSIASELVDAPTGCLMPPNGELARPLPALGDLRIVECATGVAAPFCTRVLADFGAEVVKVEPPAGDPTRHQGPFRNDTPDPEGSGLFAFLNGGKQSVLLPSAARADWLCERAASADLLVTNLSLAERTEWELDLAALRAANPRLVTLHLSPLGERGAFSGHRAYEINVCAVSASSVILGEPGRPPLHFPFNLAALQTGLHGAAAAMAALLARRRCGQGQHVEIAEADVMAYYTGGMSLFILGSGGEWRRRGFERHGTIYPSGFYPCGDGFIFIASQTRAQWKGFLHLMGDPEWAREDKALQDGVAIGWERADEVDLHFIPWLAEHTRRELTEMARKANLVLGPINHMDDLLDEPHLEARNFWGTMEVGGETLRVPGMGYAMSATPWRIGHPPRLGAQATAVSIARPTAASPGAGGTPPARPLAGYRVVEFGWNWAGPVVGQILADLGMEVVKIETNARLDFMRHWPHARKFFHNGNRGKLSVSINIKKPGGVDLVRRLTSQADIVFDNFAAGVMAKNGLGYAALKESKPDIIVLSMAMAGQSGPLHHLRGFATIATGFAGLENMIGYADTGPTGLPSLGLGDANAAIQGVLACLVALWHRENTGQGQFIDLSQIEAATTLVGEPFTDLELNGRVAGPSANDHPWMAPHGNYPVTGNDQWIAIAVATDEEWAALVRAMGDPEWARDEGLCTRAGRHVRRAELDGHLARWTVQYDREALVERLQAAGVAASPVLGIDEVRQHPHFAERELSLEMPSFEGQAGLIYQTPWLFSLTPRGVDRPSPRVGENNDYVFGEVLGMSDAERETLAAEGVLS
jgi:crotonobetainyl-CoA:carnitine CoA-transferase CaiB-like acyl-CoA transferase